MSQEHTCGWASMDDFVILKVQGQTIDLLCKVSSKYEEFIVIENGERVLYLQLLKALYRCVQSALLWYKLFSGTLQGMGFILNPYDACIANKVIATKQCMIAWHVDDMKISHEDPTMVSSIIKLIESQFGKMTVVRGKEHVFLGMSIKFNSDCTIDIHMKNYLEEALRDFGDYNYKHVMTPAKKNLFEVNTTLPKLEGHKVQVFHSIVAKLLYVLKCGWLDIQLAVVYLCTRVLVCTDEDWAKL